MHGTLPKANHVKTNWVSDTHEPYALVLESAARRAPSRRTICLASTALLLLVLFSNPGVRYHASETLSSLLGSSGNRSSSSSSSSTDFKVSKSKGICRVEYSVATFDGGHAPVCDPKLCAGREKLKILQGIPHNRRWSAFDENQYMELYNRQQISGWLQVCLQSPTATSHGDHLFCMQILIHTPFLLLLDHLLVATCPVSASQNSAPHMLLVVSLPACFTAMQIYSLNPCCCCCCYCCIQTFPQPPQIQYVKRLTAKQHELGIYGAVGEIGVHHGKFLIPIVGNALVDEPAVAMDLFEDQQANLDKSGGSGVAAAGASGRQEGLGVHCLWLCGCMWLHRPAGRR